MRKVTDNIIVYYSLTGNTKAFAERYLAEGYEVIPLGNAKPNAPYTLFTPTYNFGEVPREVSQFLDNNHGNLTEVVSFGNRNWGGKFAKAGEIISDRYGVPLIRKVEMRGTDDDYEYIKERISWRK